MFKVNESAHTSQECSTKLISSYGVEIDSQRRNSFAPSEVLKANCTNFKDSCCLDSEFNELTNIAQKNLQQILNGFVKVQSGFELFKNLNKKNINELIDLFTNDDLNDLKLTKEQIMDNLSYLHDEQDDISIDFWNSYKMLENYGAGFNCSICEASNHSNFNITDKSYNPIKLIFDFHYCYSLFNSPEMISTIEFLKHMQSINTLTLLLSRLYKTEIWDSNQLNYQVVDKVEQLRLSCLASVDDYSDDEQCAEMCLEIGMPNQFFLGKMITPLSTFVVLMTDFYGSQALLNQNVRDQSQENEAVQKSTVNVEETIRVFTDEWTVDYVLPPKNVNDELNLNQMKIELAYKKGWNFYDVRMKDWSRYLNSLSIFKNLFFVGFMIKLFF